MIDPTQYMILIDGKIATSRVAICRYNRISRMMDVQFKGSTQIYHYAYNRVVWLKNPIRLAPRNRRISYQGRCLENLSAIYVFRHYLCEYWHLCFADGGGLSAPRADFEVVESALGDSEALNRMEYLQRIAAHNSLLDDMGEALLLRQYRGMDFVRTDCALAPYLNPQKFPPHEFGMPSLIFPFGCNASQKTAVERAFTHQISVIQGPPGTGKTQTILNIIANILLQDKTVLVVSNNNSAIENVMEKLQKNHLDFLAAMLGCADNRKTFIAEQAKRKKFPQQMAGWGAAANSPQNLEPKIKEVLAKIDVLFRDQERLAVARQELDAVELEWAHYQKEVGLLSPELESRKEVSSAQWIGLWQRLQMEAERNEDPRRGFAGWWRRLRLRILSYFRFKSGRKIFDAMSAEEQIAACKAFYYQLRINELKSDIAVLKVHLEVCDLKSMMDALSRDSLAMLQYVLFRKYAYEHARPQFTKASMRQCAENFLVQYPVVLSTTFSARSNFGDDVLFDYVIMDEASQVSSDTGALALSCAARAVIVGDSLQLPNVITDEDRRAYEAEASLFKLPDAYDCAKHSFLDSVLGALDGVAQTLLREHYRCHPQIINFCNQKFYAGRLVIMTEDHGESDVLRAIRTVAGNHSRNHMNQREIDVIGREVLPVLPFDEDEIGVISPYNHQVDAIARQMEGVDVATVHKFQGREKDAIVMTTVDDRITPFSDDPNLLNVAISRAKKQFCLVVSGNEQPKDCNISDLLGYIEYHNFTVVQSKIRSIFDYLYKPYTEARLAFLRAHKHISEYDSENLTYALLEQLIATERDFGHLGIVCHHALGMLLRDTALLTDEERLYASRAGTHLDFVIYNRVSKQLVLAIETDGYEFHRAGRKQADRDRLKDSILAKYRIPLLRLSTIGSNETERITAALRAALSEVR